MTADDPFDRLKLSKMAACRQVGFDVSGNSAIHPSTLNTLPYYRTKHEVDRITGPLQRYGHSRILGAYGTNIWGKGRS